MKIFQKMGYVVLGMVMMAFLSATVIPAMAAMITKQITVSSGVKIFVDDVKLNPIGADGKPLEGFVYNGTTYLPVKAVSTAVGKPVVWNGATSSVYIGEHSSDQLITLSDINYIYENGNGFSWEKIGETAIKDNLGNTYKAGYLLDMKHSGQTDSRVYVLNKEYLRFKGVIALPSGDKDDSGISSMKIYGDDKLLFQTKPITKGYIPQKFDLNLTGVAHLKIEAIAGESVSLKNIYPPSILFTGLQFFK